MGWPDKYPVVAKHAFTFLFNQAEFGLGCPINVTDGCAKLLNNFGSEALKAKYLDGLTQTDMSKLTQGGQFMTEKEGGSDVGTLTTTAVQEGDHWRLYGEKWFCSNADAEGGDAAGAAGGRRSRHARRRPVPDAALPRRRFAKSLPDRASEGQARHPLDGLGRDQARRRDRLCGRQARSRLRADGRDGQFVAALQRRQIHRADAARAS